eukprot:745822-Hanusia_phi.AAC.3
MNVQPTDYPSITRTTPSFTLKVPHPYTDRIVQSASPPPDPPNTLRHAGEVSQDVRAGQRLHRDRCKTRQQGGLEEESAGEGGGQANSIGIKEFEREGERALSDDPIPSAFRCC